MSADTFTVGQNDTSPALPAILSDDTGRVLDLHNCTVLFNMSPYPSGAIKINGKTVTIVDASAGAVEYDWFLGDTDTPGEYRAEFVVTLASGRQVTVPNDPDAKIRVIVGTSVGSAV